MNRLPFRTATLLPIVGLAALLGAGCATHVTVTSDPPGAAVYARGKGRSIYRAEFKGTTPVTFKMYYSAMQAQVRWPGAGRSEIRSQDLHFKRNVHMDFRQGEQNPAK